MTSPAYPSYFSRLPQTIESMVHSALEEDINASAGGTDITAALIPAEKQATAQLICREDSILCGKDWFSRCFTALDDTVSIDWRHEDGDPIRTDTIICSIKGNARVILTAERSALNFLQTLSGTASLTQQYVEKIAQTNARLLDTRKTVPGFRLAQKYAVFCGGGQNHRIGLYDAYLIKENHIRASGGIEQAVKLARANSPDKPIEVEVESLDELQQAIDARADIVMLDNFTNQMKSDAVALTNGKVKLEASGDIDLQKISAVANTGVDFISIGAITKHVRATDFSLLLS